MKNSIETIWKEGFLNEQSLVVPKINDLYNRKSKHLADKIKRMARINSIALICLAIVFPVIHYFLDAIWPGVASSVLMLIIAWYSNRQMQSLKMLDHGTNSLDYLKSFDRWLKDILSKNEKTARLYYPACVLIAFSTIWSAWSSQEELLLKTQEIFPDMLFVGNIPVIALIIMGAITLLMVCFSDRIYRWDVRLMYGKIFSKLERTIAEMERLKY